MKGKNFYRKANLVSRAQMLLSPEDRALSKQVLHDYKKAFKRTPAEKQLEKDVFKFRLVINHLLFKGGLFYFVCLIH